MLGLRCQQGGWFGDPRRADTALDSRRGAGDSSHPRQFYRAIIKSLPARALGELNDGRLIGFTVETGQGGNTGLGITGLPEKALETIFQGGERNTAFASHPQHHARGPEPENAFSIEPVDILDEPISNPQHSVVRLGRQVTDARYPGHVWRQVPGVQPATWTAH